VGGDWQQEDKILGSIGDHEGGLSEHGERTKDQALLSAAALTSLAIARS